MAAPHRNRSKPDDAAQAKTRSSIRTTQLVKRLQAFALGDVKTNIDANRLRAIEILLKKTLPDLSAVTMMADIRNTISDTPLTDDEWIREHGVETPAGSATRPH